METIKMNETLLNLICYIKDTVTQVISEGILKQQALDWYSIAQKEFYGLSEKYFKKAGISPNKQNFEAILSYTFPEGLRNTEFSQLEKFSFVGSPYRKQTVIHGRDILQNLLNKYEARYERYYARKEKIRKEIIILQEQESKLRYPHWTHFILRPLLLELKRQTPEIIWEKNNRLLCFGIRAECPVFGQTKDNKTVGVTFTHEEGKLYYDTGKTVSGCPKDLNGLNCITAEVKSISQLVEFIRQQYKDQ